MNSDSDHFTLGNIDNEDAEYQDSNQRHSL